MHAEPPPGAGDAAADDGKGPWHRGLTKYHWFVLAVAALGWLFDTMDQQLFNLARTPALSALLGVTEQDPSLGDAEGRATAIFIIGWATGGLIFGVMGDKIGRAKTMMITILVYSLFTGLSAFAVGFWDFALYRFLTGLGVGGEFAVGVALVAEVMPSHARARALGWLQALSAVGNIMGALIGTGLGILQSEQLITFQSWRLMFIIGALPALLALVIRARLREPEAWQKTAGIAPGDEAATAHLTAHAPPKVQKLGSFSELFGDPVLRRNVIVGMLLASAGILGLWGIGFFSPRLVRLVFSGFYEGQGLEPDVVKGKLLTLSSFAFIFQQVGAFFGIYTFSRVAEHWGRKPTFAVAFVLAMLSTIGTFWFLGRIGGYPGALVMLFVMGFCQLSLFGGYAIYFPELFPTRLRSTGTSFCYNVARYVAATGSFSLGWLEKNVFSDFATESDPSMAMRYACVTMCSVFLIGLIALPFAPETKGKPLPE
jgi:MFS family permease